MTKELEALKRLVHNLMYNDNKEQCNIDLETIATALKRTNKLEEENENLKSAIQNEAILSSWSNTTYQNEQDEKLKALEIIKRNPVMVACEYQRCIVDEEMTYKKYCDYFDEEDRNIKSQEEYDLLKKVLK